MQQNIRNSVEWTLLDQDYAGCGLFYFTTHHFELITHHFELLTVLKYAKGK